MSLKAKIALFAVGWLVFISAAHGYLNVNWAAVLNDYRPIEKRKITVAYLPVTCQLTCAPSFSVSSWTNEGCSRQGGPTLLAGAAAVLLRPVPA